VEWASQLISLPMPCMLLLYSVGINLKVVRQVRCSVGWGTGKQRPSQNGHANRKIPLCKFYSIYGWYSDHLTQLRLRRALFLFDVRGSCASHPEWNGFSASQIPSSRILAGTYGGAEFRQLGRSGGFRNWTSGFHVTPSLFKSIAGWPALV